MENLVKFEADGKEYPLTVIDRDGNKWVMAKDLGEALGLSNIRKLIYDLVESKEIYREKHYSVVKLLNPTGGRPDVLVLSYRGVIRVAMRSQGARAKQFRDWAEEVLFEVMMTGAYGDANAIYSLGQTRGFFRGIDIAVAAKTHGLDPLNISRYLDLRSKYLGQAEAGRVFHMSEKQAYNFERKLKKAGVYINRPETHPAKPKPNVTLIPGGKSDG